MNSWFFAILIDCRNNDQLYQTGVLVYLFLDNGARLLVLSKSGEFRVPEVILFSPLKKEI